MPLLSCSGKSICPVLSLDVRASWCCNPDTCEAPNFDQQDAEYETDSYRDLLDWLADDAVGSDLRCE